MHEYIDVRGVWPVYHFGMIAVQLVGFSRSVTSSECEAFVMEQLYQLG